MKYIILKRKAMELIVVFFNGNTQDETHGFFSFWFDQNFIFVHYFTITQYY